MEDLVPRQDIAPKLTEELCDKLKDKNWKIRKEGLDEVKDIVSSAKFITGDLGTLPASLAPRTSDANKILAMQAIEMIGRWRMTVKEECDHLLFIDCCNLLYIDPYVGGALVLQYVVY